MGREARCLCRWGADLIEVKALLESHEIILRGNLKRRIPISELQQVRTEGADLCFQVGVEEISLTLGADEAARWMRKITTPLPTLKEKMGIGPACKAFVIGDLTEASVLEAPDGAEAATAAEAGLSIAVVENEADLNSAIMEHAALLDGSRIWLVYRKGRSATFGESSIRQIMRAQGFIDTKITAVSTEFTATSYSRS